MHDGRRTGGSRPAGVEPTARPPTTWAPVASVYRSVGFTDNESTPAAPPTVPHRLRNLGLRLLRALVDTATVAGTATVAILSAEVAHDLSTRRTGPARDRPTACPSEPPRWVTTPPAG